MAAQMDLSDELAHLDGGVSWERLAGKSLLVTGATGLIGSYLVELLLVKSATVSTPITVVAAGRSGHRLLKRFAKFARQPALQLLDISGGIPEGTEVDYVIHCGGNATPATIGADPVGTMDANFNGMKAVLEFARDNPVERVLYVSSSEVYGDASPAPYALTEDSLGRLDILSPRASYPSSKRATETLCVSFIEQYGIDVVISRPGYIFGPTIASGDNRVIPQFMSNALAEQPIVMLSDGSRARSYCYVGDCATALMVTLLEGVAGKAYNVAHRASDTTIGHIAEIVAELGSTSVHFKAEATSRAPQTPDRVLLDAAALASLGWVPQYDITRGLTATYLHLRGA
jgi:UDP-glucuronate decarboxylase